MKDIFAEPSKEVPLIVLAVANVVAVSALPVTSPVTLPVTLPVKLPVTLPVKAPSKVAATKVSEPTVHLSSVSFQTKVLFVCVPRSISIPPFSVGVAPVKLEFKTIWLSARLIVSVLIVVVVPETVKSPETVTSLKVTSLVVPTACPIDIAPVELL